MKEQRTHARSLVNGYFLLEGLNSFGTTIYFYYLYFFTERIYGFSKVQNFCVAAGLGLVYCAGSVVGGRFAQRRGYLLALKCGCAIMAVLIASGAFVTALPAHFIIIFVGVVGMALTWPALEALVSEGAPPEDLPRNIGIYNLVWAGAGACAYFIGGSMIKAWTFRSMFLVPAVIFVLEIIIIALLERAKSRMPAEAFQFAKAAPLPDEEEERLHALIHPATFLRMAWLANPLAYLAINTILAAVPSIANKLALSLGAAGIVCSLWQFVRAGSFVLLWKWKAWHYRFGWLVVAYVAMTAGFVTFLVAPNLPLLIAAQVLFGLGTGLVYYSSLYYSMHVGEAKGEHGGFHEAMIGVGSFAGPAISAIFLHLLPQRQGVGAIAVASVLLSGLLVLVRWRYAKRSRLENKMPITPV
ncbi:MAG TPA: MFS transporter [Candidatus Acidoferrum sp.]|nr:MFS transporter [Candidatus Acidoferrum sp.]